jgi:hypothetical protein
MGFVTDLANILFTFFTMHNNFLFFILFCTATAKNRLFLKKK